MGYIPKDLPDTPYVEPPRERLQRLQQWTMDAFGHSITFGDRIRIIAGIFINLEGIVLDFEDGVLAIHIRAEGVKVIRASQVQFWKISQ